MISRTEKQNAADPITQSYIDLETLIMQNIIRHVSTYDQLIDSDDWLMTMLAQLGVLNRENIQIIAKAAVSADAVEAMCYEVSDTVISRIEPGLTELEREGVVKSAVPVEKSENLKRAVETVHKQAKDSLNLCNTTMLYKAQEAYKQLVQSTVEQAKEIAEKQEFLDILGKHATAEVVGAESRQQAIRNTIKEFNELGIPAFVDKKGRNWTPEAYVSMTIRATAGNVSTEAMFARMEDRELNLMAVSSHSGARPKCAKDQGKIFDRNNGSGEVEDLNGKKIKYYPLSSSSYGEPDGLFGINCGHHGVPFIPGISRQRYFPTEDFVENDKLYKKMQIQRAHERDVRKQKRLCMLYDKVGLQDSFEEAAVKLKAKEAKLADYVKQNKLIRRKDRESVVGFDKKVSARAVAAHKRYTKAQKTDTIPIKDTIIRKSVGSKFRNYKVVDKTTGIEYEFVPGTRIQNSEVFAGKGTRHPLHEGVAEGLTEEYGGTPSKWQHAKGNGVLLDDLTGEEYPAEVHWFQEESVGKVKFKVKRWLDNEG